MCSLKNGEKPLVLSSFRSKMRKTFGFTMFSVKHGAKPLVLFCFRPKMVKNQRGYSVCIRKLLKTDNFIMCFAQLLWKTNGFIVFSLKKSQMKKNIGFS